MSDGGMWTCKNQYVKMRHVPRSQGYLSIEIFFDSKFQDAGDRKILSRLSSACRYNRIAYIWIRQM